MAEENYKLWCLFEKDSKFFSVSISPSEHVYALKKLIYKEWEPVLSKTMYSPVNLILTKVDVNFIANQDNILAGNFQANDNDISLHGMEKISDVWQIQPPSGFVNVAVRLSATTVLGKRTRSVDELDSIQDSKIFTTAPSKMGKLIEYKSLQENPVRRILDDRPAQDLVPPASLLYDGFGHFLDIFRRREDVHDLSPTRRNLEWEVDSFAEVMSTFHQTEDERKMEGIRALNAILFEMPSLASILPLASIDSNYIHSNGHYYGPHGAISCIVEIKNELVDINSIPLVELISHVAHSHAQAMKRHQALYLGWRVPCLGITIVGPYVRFYAVILLRQLRVVSLTPALSCVASAGEGDDRKALYAAFSGALDLLRRIDEDAKRFLSTPPEILHRDIKYPYISVLPRHDDSSKEVHFRILRLHPDTQSYRLLYIAESLDRRPLMVKFTRCYSIRLHAFCAERGHAPGIRGFKQLPGGWFVIAMDYISPDFTSPFSPPLHPSQSPHFARLLDTWIQDLQKLMQSFHDEGLVHGDLRGPNMLCDGERVVLVDFDWGGEVGKACYPHARLCPELWNDRDGSDPVITKEDDRRVLHITLEGLKRIAATVVT